MRAPLCLALAAVALAASTVHAAPSDVPQVMTQTGRLFDAGGAPVAGDITMVFALYDAPTGGAQEGLQACRTKPRHPRRRDTASPTARRPRTT